MAEARGKVSKEQLGQLVKDGAIDTVVLAICDMQGRLMGKRVLGEYFVEYVQDHGTHFTTYLLGTDMDMETPQGYELMNWETGYGDWLAVPDWNTLRVVPWLEKTAIVLADAVDEASGDLVSVAPRTILRKQLERAADAGYAVNMASELEYYLLKDTFEEAYEKGYNDLSPVGYYNEDYHLLQGTKTEPVYRQVRNLMTEAGIPIEFSKGEAAAGQHEVNIRYADALESADRHVLFKHGAKELAILNSLSMTFMAKPDHNWSGSSSHLHISLCDKETGSNVFHEPGDDPEKMSQKMRYFLGGMMKYARELSLFVASNVNSYKRYALESWAPVNLVWGRDNRTCSFRIVGGGQSLRIENRIPGADANPYLAYSAVLAAGLHGIEEKIDPPDEFFGNGYAVQNVPRIPSSLYEAVAELDRSDVARKLFGDLVVDHYVHTGRIEQQTYDGIVTAWERERYLERG